MNLRNGDFSEMKILLVEDDLPVANFVQKGLQAEHHAVEVLSDGEQARNWIAESDFDLLILDVGLPKVDGMEVLKYVRESRAHLPVLMLTAKGKVEDRVRGFDMGADDYLPKPFSFSELSARVRALLRRGSRPAEMKLKMADLEIDMVEHIVTRGGKRIELSAREFALLTYLMRNPGRCLSRAMIMEHVWNLDFDTNTNVVDVYINYLRVKLDKEYTPKLIQTVRGVGYKMNVKDDRVAVE